MKEEVLKQLAGYDRIAQEIAVTQRYGVDYSAQTGSAAATIDLLHPARLQLKVVDIIQETPSAMTFRLASRDGYLPPFQAGQYIALAAEVGGVRTSRPYSISSSPTQVGYYDLTVRRVEDGLISNHLLDRLRRGDELTGSGPAGHFYHQPLFHDRSLVFLAGGSGITPFMSMIRETVETGLDRTLHLFYGNREFSDVIFHERLMDLAARFENFHYHPVIEHPSAGYDGLTGLITGRLLAGTLGDLSGKTFYLCGPQGMYDFVLPELEALGLARRKIRREVYGPPQGVSHSPGWPEEIRPSDAFRVSVGGRSAFQARAGEPLLAALERRGYGVPSLCRSGECSMCRIRIVSGRVFMPAGTPLRKSDHWFGYVHSCVSYPLSDLEIVL